MPRHTPILGELTRVVEKTAGESPLYVTDEKQQDGSWHMILEVHLTPAEIAQAQAGAGLRIRLRTTSLPAMDFEMGPIPQHLEENEPDHDRPMETETDPDLGLEGHEAVMADAEEATPPA